MNVLDLFSNIGSHALGMRDAGHDVVQFVEIDRRRRGLLAHYFPGIPLHDDVRTFDRAPCHIIIGGPPCQRTSVSAAIHGRRTGDSLWPDMLRIGLNSRAEWFVVEQPPGNAEWEAKVTGDLARVGFHVARSEFAASELGAPHIRRRVFFLANACLARLAVAWQAIPQEIDRIARAAAAGNPWHEGPPRTLRVADGPSGWLDRNAAVAAIGDSNPPAMATVIGRAIMIAQQTTRLRTMSEWQPITTAPKGETPLLGFIPSYFQGRGGMAVILWADNRWWDNMAFETKPTHWMSLPEPPIVRNTELP